MSTPVGPYSPFRQAGEFIYFSGQIGIKSGAVVNSSLEDEFNQVFENLNNLIIEAKANKEQIVKANVFLTNIDNYELMNEHYNQFFDGLKPARSAVAVKSLPLNANLEIEVIAFIGN